MSAEEFLADIEGGAVPVNCHNRVLRIAFIYMDEALWNGSGVFDVVEKLHGSTKTDNHSTLDILPRPARSCHLPLLLRMAIRQLSQAMAWNVVLAKPSTMEHSSTRSTRGLEAEKHLFILAITL